MQSPPNAKLHHLFTFWEYTISTFFGNSFGTSPYQIECHALCLFGSVSFIHALPFSCHEVSVCLFVCWSCPVCVEAVYRRSAMP